MLGAGGGQSGLGGMGESRRRAGDMRIVATGAVGVTRAFFLFLSLVRERTADFSDDPVEREKLMMREKVGRVSGAVS